MEGAREVDPVIGPIDSLIDVDLGVIGVAERLGDMFEHNIEWGFDVDDQRTALWRETFGQRRAELRDGAVAVEEAAEVDL